MKRFIVLLALLLGSFNCNAALNEVHNRLNSSVLVQPNCSVGAAILSQAITTNGSWVQIDFDILIGLQGGSFSGWNYKLYRDSTLIFDSSRGGLFAFNTSQTTVTWMYHDLPSTGAHTYHLSVCTVSGTVTVWPGTAIGIWELKTD